MFQPVGPVCNRSIDVVLPPQPVPPLRSWREAYWAWRRRGRTALRALGLRQRLAWLRRRALTTPRRQPGCLTLDGYRIYYSDLLSLYVEYKQIFGLRLYDFRPSGPRPLVLDCGSHIGLSVLRFKRLVPTCRVIAFEPDPIAGELLRRNLAENNIRDVEIVPAALAGARGFGRFVADGADGGALARTGLAPRSAPAVPTVPLRDYLAEPVDFLKMNIEGAECDVLAAAAERLHLVRQMAVEYHGFPELGQRLHELLGLLDECGFRYALHHLDYESNGALRPPFRLGERVRFFQVIAAERVREPRMVVPATPRAAPAGVPVAQRCAPASRKFGFDRGQPIDRLYIEHFLDEHRADVRGRVLEVGDDNYIRKFGGPAVTHRDILHVQPVPAATLVADLTQPDGLPRDAYDCFICTQTLLMIFDVAAALRGAHRLLRPGGVLLATVPGISQISCFDAERWGDYWRFTPLAVKRLLDNVFAASRVTIRVYGNLRAAQALLDGRAVHELPADELAYVDEQYPVTIAARAVK